MSDTTEKNYGESEAFLSADVWGLEGDEVIDDDSPLESVERAMEYGHPDLPTEVEVIAYVEDRDAMRRIAGDWADRLSEHLMEMLSDEFGECEVPEHAVNAVECVIGGAMVAFVDALPSKMREVGRHTYGADAIANVAREWV